MNTRIDHIARRQTRLGGFAPSPSPELVEEPSDSGDDEGDNAYGSEYDAEMTPSP